MTWQEAKQKIDKHVKLGTNVDTVKKDGSKKSHYRTVKCVLDDGYMIGMAVGHYMFVTWDMLEKCWKAMNINQGVYDIQELKKHYPEHPRCYVQTIHMIFEKAGLT